MSLTSWSIPSREEAEEFTRAYLSAQQAYYEEHIKMEDKPNKITAALRVVATGEFYDDEASEETLRCCVEQDLEDAGFDVDVELLKERDAVKIKVRKINGRGRCGRCPSCGNELNEMDYPNYCGFCGQAVKWNE